MAAATSNLLKVKWQSQLDNKSGTGSGGWYLTCEG
jgi:hypothetical protein